MSAGHAIALLDTARAKAAGAVSGMGWFHVERGGGGDAGWSGSSAASGEESGAAGVGAIWRAGVWLQSILCR